MRESGAKDSEIVEATDAPTLHKVVFVLASGRYIARPSYPIVLAGDQVRFINHAGVTIDLTFSNPDLFGTATLSIPNGQKRTRTVGPLLPNHYPYEGVSAGDRQPLIGDSNPEIIIDD